MSQAHPESLRAYEIGQKDPEEGLRILDKLLIREKKRPELITSTAS